MDRLEQAEELLTRALENHDLEQRSNRADHYDVVRKLRRDGNRVWADIRQFLTAEEAPPIELPKRRGRPPREARAAD